MRFIAPVLTANEARACFRDALSMAKRINPPKTYMVVEARKSKRTLGICAVPQMDLPKRRAEVGMMLRSDACDRGMGQEGLSAFIDRAFATLPVDEIWVQYRRGHHLADGMVCGMGFLFCEPREGGADPATQLFRCMSRDTWNFGESLLARKN